MKTFKDLEFFNHKLIDIQSAPMNFKNGYRVNVITGRGTKTSIDKPYELTVLKDNEMCYDTHIWSDNIGYLTEEDVTATMIKIQKLK